MLIFVSGPTDRWGVDLVLFPLGHDISAEKGERGGAGGQSGPPPCFQALQLNGN